MLNLKGYFQILMNEKALVVPSLFCFRRQYVYMMYVAFLH